VLNSVFLQSEPRLQLESEVVLELLEEQIRNADNHRNLAEIPEAVFKGQGRSKRYSSDLGTDVLRVTSQYGDGEGFISVAKILDKMNPTLAGFQLLLVYAVILGVGIAVLLSLCMSYIMSGRLRNLVKHARELVDPKEGERNQILISSKGEIGRLAGSINRMALEIERLMSSLAKERDRFEAVLEGMGEGVLALDENLYVTHANTAALSFLGLSALPTGYTLLEVTRSPDLNELVSKSKTAKTNMVEFELPGEVPRRLQATVATQQATGASVVVIYDISELRRLEALHRDFIANVSHELRTPLSIIKADAETLLENVLEGRPCPLEFLEALHRNSERLSNIIADLLEISRIESGQYAIELRAIRIEDAIRKTLGSMQTRAAAAKLKLKADVELKLSVLADSKALDRILFNLIDNAVKYTPEGGHIVVRALRTGDKVRIEVCDDGYGIETKHKDRIFERFYRVDAGRSREMGGTGLGLSIVEDLTVIMNGQVGLDNGHPRGSIFWVLLPVAMS